jgi:sarcosine oxidase subunit beta
MTPDHHAVLGPVPSVEGFFLANGFSGHGVMHAPATGKIISDFILQGATDLIDPKALAWERFQTGKLLHETAVL